MTIQVCPVWGCAQQTVTSKNLTTLCVHVCVYACVHRRHTWLSSTVISLMAGLSLYSMEHFEGHI